MINASSCATLDLLDDLGRNHDAPALFWTQSLIPKLLEIKVSISIKVSIREVHVNILIDRLKVFFIHRRSAYQ